MNKAEQTNKFFLFLILFYIISSFIFIPLIPEKFLTAQMSIIVGQLTIIIPTIIYMYVARYNPLKKLPFKKISISNVFLIMLFTYLMIPLITFINAVSMYFVENKVSATMIEMNSNSLLLNLFLMAILPAFVEEFVFRGIIYHGYRDSKIRRAIIASAFMFGMFHMNINQLLYAFVMGIIFALMIEATGSIFSSMIMHFTFNANTVFLIKSQEKTMDKVESVFNSNNYSEDTVNELARVDLSTIALLGIVAFLFTTLAVLLFNYIAKRCNRDRHIRSVLPFRKQLHEVCSYVGEEEYVENKDKPYGGKIVNYVFVIAMYMCIIMMIFMEIMT